MNTETLSWMSHRVGDCYKKHKINETKHKEWYGNVLTKERYGNVLTLEVKLTSWHAGIMLKVRKRYANKEEEFLTKTISG